MKWWLISDEDINFIRQALSAPTHRINDFNCPDRLDGCYGCEGDEQRENAIHHLDTGLHITNAIPDDFKE